MINYPFSIVIVLVIVCYILYIFYVIYFTLYKNKCQCKIPFNNSQNYYHKINKYSNLIQNNIK